MVGANLEVELMFACGQFARVGMNQKGLGDRRNMDPINLEPRYSTKDVPGKCIKCLAEQSWITVLGNCWEAKMKTPEQYQRYEALLAFLQSEESERYLAGGKQVTVMIRIEEGKFGYELQIENKENGGTNQ